MTYAPIECLSGICQIEGYFGDMCLADRPSLPYLNAEAGLSHDGL